MHLHRNRLISYLRRGRGGAMILYFSTANVFAQIPTDIMFEKGGGGGGQGEGEGTLFLNGKCICTDTD